MLKIISNKSNQGPKKKKKKKKQLKIKINTKEA